MLVPNLLDALPTIFYFKADDNDSGGKGSVDSSRPCRGLVAAALASKAARDRAATDRNRPRHPNHPNPTTLRTLTHPTPTPKHPTTRNTPGTWLHEENVHVLGIRARPAEEFIHHRVVLPWPAKGKRAHRHGPDSG